MSLQVQLKEATAKAIEDLYQLPVSAGDVLINQTKPEFEGDYTVVLFSFVKQLKTSPDKLGREIGGYLVANKNDLFTSYNVIKGFLNLTVNDAFYLRFLKENYDNQSLAEFSPTHKKIMVEYSSPNTNKPLHLGHLRNNFLGWSVAGILKATGNNVMKTCVVNDRGIHICKSMIAWQLLSNGETPESTGIKGDHFVGDYYVKCEAQIKKEASELADKVEAADYSAFSDTDKQKLIELKELGNAVIGTTDKDREKLKKIGDDIKEII